MPQRGIYFLLAAVVFLVVGIITANRFRNESYSHKDARKFEKVLHKKERLLQSELEQLQALLADGSPTEVLDRHSSKYQKLAARHGISIYYYEKGILKYWSDHSIPLPNTRRVQSERSYISLRNADYVSVVRQLDEGRLVGLIEIKTHFPFQNDFLINGFQRDFSLDPDVEIEILEANGSESIYNEDGNYLFSLDLSDTVSANTGLKTIAISSLLLFIFLISAGFNWQVKEAKGAGKWLWISIVTLFIVAGGIAILKYSFPTLLTETKLFQPELFASHFFPSLGSLLVISLMAIVLGSLYYQHGNLLGIRSQRGRLVLSLLLYVLWVEVLLMT